MVSQPPLIFHLVYRLDVGGLENGLINIVNHLPQNRYRHAIACLHGWSSFKERLTDPSVQLFDLQRKDGRAPSWYPTLWALMRRLRPAVFHSRNLPTLEGQIVAAALGVPLRIHGEHGRDVYDPHGEVRRYRWLRRAIDPLIHQYVAVSTDLRDWLVDQVGVRARKVRRIPNGVDTDRFAAGERNRAAWPDNFRDPRHVVIGTVGRMTTVKDQLTLVRAFCRILERHPEWRQNLRLVAAGDGPLRDECLNALQAGGVAALAWFPGNRTDVPALMRGFDVFVLPSRAEGMSNTILEAMATSLPVVATAVGGNGELVQDGFTGRLVPPSDEEAMAAAISSYVATGEERLSHGRRGRIRVESDFSIDRMAVEYQQLYDAIVPALTGGAKSRSGGLPEACRSNDVGKAPQPS